MGVGQKGDGLHVVLVKAVIMPSKAALEHRPDEIDLNN
jgi:hypothetical protein